MKKSICTFAAAAIASLNIVSCKTADKAPAVQEDKTAAVQYDWAGTYAGVIPSASGEGIDVKIALNADKTYKQEYRYIGKGDEVFADSGAFALNQEENTVIFENGNGRPPRYKLGENILTQLDLEGNVITGELADNYILKKQQ